MQRSSVGGLRECLMSIFAKDLSLMITALNMETLSLERTISANCLSGFVQYEPVNVVFGNRNIYAECSIDYVLGTERSVYVSVG